MPRYDGSCDKCGIIEIVKSMNEPWPAKCPECGAKFDRVFNTQSNFNKAVDANWENENNGLGRYLPQAGPRYLDAYTKTKPNPDAYARNINQAVDKMKRRGYPDISRD